MYHSTFRLGGIPIFYFPWVQHPVDKLGRQTGFLIPTMGQSSVKGTILGEGIFWAINRQMDATIGAEYFSHRGWAQHASFRARPTDTSYFNMTYFGVLDRGAGSPKVDQGGEEVRANGEIQLPHGFRAVHNFTWFTFGDQALRIGWVLDPLAAAMMVMITLVGLCIFVFSVGYMAGDKNFTRFFAYLSFFSGAMLGVVIANSLLLLFVSWELVGLASYLLIGFWIERPSAAAMASATFLATSGPRTSAKAVGPLPEIELPSAPAASAASVAGYSPPVPSNSTMGAPTSTRAVTRGQRGRHDRGQVGHEIEGAEDVRAGVVDFERDVLVHHDAEQLAPLGSAEEQCVPVDDVVDRKDVGVVGDRHGEPTDLLRSEQAGRRLF